MASDGPDPKLCDQKIFAKGEVVCILHSIPPNAIEALVRSASKISRQKIDWHFFGGRAVIKTLGDVQKAIDAFEHLEPVRLYLYEQANHIQREA